MYFYLRDEGLAKAAEALKAETEIDEDSAKKDLLVKKWTSVIRLQKKVCD